MVVSYCRQHVALILEIRCGCKAVKLQLIPELWRAVRNAIARFSLWLVQLLLAEVEGAIWYHFSCSCAKPLTQVK